MTIIIPDCSNGNLQFTQQRPHYYSYPAHSWPAAAWSTGWLISQWGWGLRSEVWGLRGLRDVPMFHYWLKVLASLFPAPGVPGVTVECDNTPSLVMGLLLPHSSHSRLSRAVTPPVRILINFSSHNSGKSPSLLTVDYEPEKKEMFQVLWAESLLMVENILTLKIF